jgi:hypothetical protein
MPDFVTADTARVLRIARHDGVRIGALRIDRAIGWILLD